MINTFEKIALIIKLSQRLHGKYLKGLLGSSQWWVTFITFSLHFVIIIWFLSCEPYECCSWAVIVRRQTLLKSNLLLLGGCVAAMGFGKRVNSRPFICFFYKARFRIWVMVRAIICRVHGIYNVKYIFNLLLKNGVQALLEGLDKLAFFLLLNVRPNSRGFGTDMLFYVCIGAVDVCLPKRTFYFDKYPLWDLCVT